MDRMSSVDLDRYAQDASEQARRVGSLYRPGWNALERPMPLLQLAGEWLASAGFAPGDEVRVLARDGRLLVVRRDRDAEWED